MNTTLAARLEERIRHELPGLSDAQAAELASMLDRLVHAIEPEQIYVFGSQARHEAPPDSDIDILIVAPHSDAPRYRRAQEAYGAIGPHLLPVDIIVLTRAEFDSRRDVPSSLPATVLREGRALYAA